MRPSKLIKRRLLAAVPVAWRVDNCDGSSFDVDFEFCLTFREVAKVEIKCSDDTLFSSGNVWKNITTSRIFPLVVWGAVIHNHSEYDNDEGLTAIAEYLTGIDEDTQVKIMIALAKAYAPVMPSNLRPGFEESIKAMEAGETLPDPEKVDAPNPQKAEIETHSEASGQSADTISASATTNSAA